MLFLCFLRALWRTIDSQVSFGTGIGSLKEENPNTVWYSWVYTFGGTLGFASRQMGRNQRVYSVTVWVLWQLKDEILWEFAFILENAGINFAFTIVLTMVSASFPVTKGQEKFSAMDESDLSCTEVLLLAYVHNEAHFLLAWMHQYCLLCFASCLRSLPL